MKNLVKQLNDKLQENNRKIWGNHEQITRNKSCKKNPKKLPKVCPSLPESMSTTHFNPEALRSTIIPNQSKSAFTGENPRNRRRQSGRRGLWDQGRLSWGHYCTQSSLTHTSKRTQDLVADNSRLVIFDCGPLMLDQRHLTQSWASAPLVSRCRHGATARELLQLYRTNTEICLCKRLVVMLK